MDRTDLRQAAGQMLVAGFDGHDLPPYITDALAHGRLGGVVLFARNLGDVEQIVALNSAIQDAVGTGPLPFVAVDQEGGRVQRLREPPFTRLPPMAAVGATGDAELAAQIGEVIGAELEAVGFNLDFAPCVDVFTNAENTVIGDRAFGTEPDRVARMAGAVMTGLLASGIVPCAKHFPGHGDTRLDSHVDLPVIEHDLPRIQQVELEPFRRMIAAQVPMIMTAHVLVPAVDDRRPATLSPQWVGEILRRRMKYGGVIVSDDLEMGAVADRWDVAELVELGLHAGLDLYLICHQQAKVEQAFGALVKLGERSSHEREQIAMAAGRVGWLKRAFLRRWYPADDVRALLGTAEHAARVARVHERSA